MQFQKSTAVIVEQNRIQQTKNATEYDQIKLVNPLINFKNPQAFEKEKNGGEVIQIIESENPLNLEDPIIQSAAIIAARKAQTNRHLVSFFLKKIQHI
ncbi:MAG: hypothetical protein WCK98_07275 [bacterium]